ncbi:MAG: hypothetical protein JNK85_30140 [Verrucomicrobiales bacterium]|nr:hypothetical protein [Verrucomicrobiales bacterium]
MNHDLVDRLRITRQRLVKTLVGQLEPSGRWTGELSSSALSTAVATIALGEVARRGGPSDPADGARIRAGLDWLATHANHDGGWGDTPRSRSNLSTTALVWAAFGAAAVDSEPTYAPVVTRAVEWLTRHAGSLEHLVPAIEARYGDDRTFSVPIVLTLALSGRLGPTGWKKVRPLPFELAVFPRSWFGALQLPVVSYAMPALIALGQAIHHHAPSPQPWTRWLRQLTRDSTLHRLISLQPGNGGFLEATPLTAFVTMSLASMGAADHAVTRRAAAFLRNSTKPDGSWPIDTNLSTWVSTLSVKALRSDRDALPASGRAALLEWLMGQQQLEVHPYTGAAPGGWAWTDLPGGVPDADDTAGALLALDVLDHESWETRAAAERGVAWLLQLQNRDGGIPTFCRGWGRLPFDRSAPELTAHALRAWAAWAPRLSGERRHALERSTDRALDFLVRTQATSGAWLPLWFGNEHAADDANPVYGTSQVLIALADQPASDTRVRSMRQSGRRFLMDSQGESGGWGGDAQAPPTVEETSLALRGLAAGRDANDGATRAIERGAAWLLDRLEVAEFPEANPIGLYFAKLWYYESLYPLIFAIEGLGGALDRFCRSEKDR